MYTLVENFDILPYVTYVPYGTFLTLLGFSWPLPTFVGPHWPLFALPDFLAFGAFHVYFIQGKLQLFRGYKAHQKSLRDM